MGTSAEDTVQIHTNMSLHVTYTNHFLTHTCMHLSHIIGQNNIGIYSLKCWVCHVRYCSKATAGALIVGLVGSSYSYIQLMGSQPYIDWLWISVCKPCLLHSIFFSSCGLVPGDVIVLTNVHSPYLCLDGWKWSMAESKPVCWHSSVSQHKESQSLQMGMPEREFNCRDSRIPVILCAYMLC